jgi:putative glutamine amidotransferase
MFHPETTEERTTAMTGTRQPLIGVMCCNRTVDGRPSQAVSNRFLAPLASMARASALIVPAIPGMMDPALAAATLDGLMLTGSCSNVAPARYGSDAEEDHPDHDRDETASRLAGAMIEAGRPVFGICRGMQELNVLFGGSLDTHVGHRLAHHARLPDDGSVEALFENGHEIDVVAGGRLEGMLGIRRGTVNSVHRQGVARLGRGLAVEATAPDGLVEAFHARPAGGDVLGVQWHPEHDAFVNPHGRAFFEAAGRTLRGEALAH